MSPESTKELSETEKAEIREKALEAVKKKIVVVDASHLAEMEARDAADAYMTEDKTEGGKKATIWKKLFWKRLWRHTFFDEYYRQKKLNEIRNEIINSDNIYTAVDKDKAAHDSAMEAITTRFTSEYDEAVNSNAGEGRDALLANDRKSLETKAEIKKLISDYAQGDIPDEATFKAEKNRIFGEVNHELIKGASTYADNLLEIAKNAKLAIEHGAKLEELDLDLNIIIGKAKSSIKTEARNNWVDEAVSRAKKTKIGRIINPATLSTALGLVYSIGAIAGKGLLRNKASHIATFGATAAVSGALSGINESQRLAQERRQHGREMAKGAVIEGNSPERERMEKYAYQTESATVLINNLRNSLFTRDAQGKEIPKEITQAELDTVIGYIRDIEARNALADKKKIDLISYSNPQAVEKERTELTILLARAKVEMRRQMEEGSLKGSLTGDTFDTFLAKQVETTEKAFLGGEAGIDTRDRLFRNMKLKRSGWKAIKTALMGAGIGAAAQELVAGVDGLWGGNRQSVIEGLLHHGDTTNHVETPLGHLTRSLLGHPSNHISMENVHEQILGDAHIKLPEGVNIIPNPEDGTYNIVNGDHVVADHIKLETDVSGGLDPASIDRLGEAGIINTTAPAMIDGGATVTVSPDDYVNSHLDHTTHVARDGWYDNDTPKPIFDKNELKLWWGGGGNTGIDANGNFVFNVSHMTSGGSFHDGLSVDAQEKIKHGGLKIFLSLTRGTQTHPFPVDIDIYGNATIPPDSEIGRLFFSTDANGHAVFHGKYAEVSETFGNDASGRLHVKELATYVGPDHGEITIPGPKSIIINELQIPLDHKVDPPYFIPIVPRRPLESIGYRKKLLPEPLSFNNQMEYYLNYNGGATSEEKLALFEKLRSKTLKENPNAKLDHYKEIADYLEKQDKAYLERVKRLSQTCEKMEKECKVSVCIPVAGHQEGNQIYESLKNYTYQTAKPEEYEIVLYVNHPEKDRDGNILNADETLAEIEKFKTNHPTINIRIMYEILPNEEAKIGRIRKILSDATLIRQNERGKDAPDLIMISNDADNKGIDPKYIQTFINKFEDNPTVDALLGQLDWDPESYQKYPAIHIGTRLFQYLSVIGRHKTNSMVSSGANSAFRSSMFAGIGGYIDNLEGGEDISIGQAIIKARGDNKKALGFAGVNTRLFTSSRRSIDALKSGLAPVEQWNKGFSAFDDEVRKLTMEQGDAIDYNDRETQIKLKKSLEYIINRTLDSWESGEKLGKDNAYYSKALGWLGIKYTLDYKGDVLITSMTSLIKGLKGYQIEGKLMRDARSGKPEAIEKLNRIRGKDTGNKSQKSIDTNNQNKLNFNVNRRAQNINELLNSQNKENIDGYIIAKDFVLSDAATGKVSLAYRPGDNKILVAKEVSTSYLNDWKKSRFWGNETPESFLASKGFKNPGVLLPLKTFEQNGKTYRFYEAGDTDLLQYLGSNKLSADESVSSMLRISEIVDSLNDAGVINVDISPGNIILTKNSLRLTDLDGAAINPDSNGISRQEFPNGNRFAMAPELFKDTPSFDKTVDVYAASANLYRYITGKWPYNIEEKTKGLSPSEKFAEYEKLHEQGVIRFPRIVPTEIKNVIKKGMSPDPKDRYPSMKEFISELRKANDKVKQKANKPKTLNPNRQKTNKNSRLTREFMGRLSKEPRLMKLYRKWHDGYFAMKDYKNLDDDSPTKVTIDGAYEEYKKIAGNEDKDKETFLKDSISAIEAEFAKQMQGIKDSERKTSVVKKIPKRRVASKRITQAA